MIFDNFKKYLCMRGGGEEMERWLVLFKERDVEEVIDWGKSRGFGLLMLIIVY